MGNKESSIYEFHVEDDQTQKDAVESWRKLSEVTKENIRPGFSFTDFSNSLSLRSFGSFLSRQSVRSTASTTRPWSKVSRREWSEQTLSNPYDCSKTAWPVPFIESIFLPEFKINTTEQLFQVIGCISTGAFGRVYKVIKTDTRNVYAMKILSKSRIISENAVQQVKDEVKIQHMCGHHPFIANCPFFWQSKKKLYIVSDFIPNGELFKLVQNNGAFSEELVKIYVAELAIVLDFLHNAGVIYRDLKLENILIDSHGHIQLIDFGLSKWLKYGNRTNTLCGTLQYIAPEIMQRQAYGHAVDWWSLGIVMWTLLAGECPASCSVDEQGRLVSFPDISCSKQAKDLLDRLLQPDPSQRLKSLFALKRTAFYQHFNFEDLKSRRVIPDCMPSQQ